MTGPRVLIVDDDCAFVDAVAIYLEDHGFHAVKAYCGQDGLSLLRRQSFDLAVLDVHLPDMEGTRLAAEFRQRRPSASVVMVSSDDSPQTTAQCVGAGVRLFIPKPLSPKTLLESLRLLCDGAAGSMPASPRGAAARSGPQ